ncbi:hypothetical protein [Pseudoalteromonas spongiae]|uniref:hypothetical protein n=1 Tax=Pseudoalteromonas spongiae TaxID=298657 RepID=UPI00110B33E4|nr:hypothetical protein [Pseudoalteromonas spongiae]TMO82790.1 hypothetical protein CWC15_18035 [Pseudoalteromonas spongiae]
MKKTGITILALGILATGCTSDTDSDLLKTKAIQAEILVSSNGERTKVNAELNSGNSFGSNVRLSNGDKIYAEVHNKRIQLEEDTDILDIDYEGRFSGSEESAEFKVELIRSSAQNASSTVELPLNFKILAPNSNSEIRYNQSVNVLLDGVDVGSKNEFILNYICDNNNGGTTSGSASRQFENKSSFTLNLHTLKLLENVNLSSVKNCELDVIINRYKVGQISSELADSSQIRAEQTRKIENITFKI